MSNMITYIIKTNVSPYYKIGKTKDLQKRKKQIIGSASFIEIDVCHVFDLDIERELHALYSDYRVKGEWFNIGQEQLSEIKNIDVSKVKLFFEDTSDVLFTSAAMVLMQKMSRGAKDLFWHLSLKMPKDTTVFYFYKWDYMTDNRIGSIKKVEESIKELEELQVMKSSDKPHWYWANPEYLYKGCKIKLYKLIQSSKK